MHYKCDKLQVEERTAQAILTVTNMKKQEKNVFLSWGTSEEGNDHSVVHKEQSVIPGSVFSHQSKANCGSKTNI